MIAHHYGAYPGTGSAVEAGQGRGAGKILNVPMPPGAGDAQFLQAFETRLVPAARNFKADTVDEATTYSSSVIGHSDAIR